MKRIKSWWIAFNKATGNWCDKHQHTHDSRIFGCMDCTQESVEEYCLMRAAEKEAARVAQVEKDAEIYANAVVGRLLNEFYRLRSEGYFN
jgi:hypothetical protein